MSGVEGKKEEWSLVKQMISSSSSEISIDMINLRVVNFW